MDISNATAQVTPDLIKALVILWDTTFRRSAVDRGHLESYWKSKKMFISINDKQACYLQVFYRLYQPQNDDEKHSDF